jgi:hypothetical protein
MENSPPRGANPRHRPATTRDPERLLKYGPRTVPHPAGGVPIPAAKWLTAARFCSALRGDLAPDGPRWLFLSCKTVVTDDLWCKSSTFGMFWTRWTRAWVPAPPGRLNPTRVRSPGRASRSSYEWLANYSCLLSHAQCFGIPGRGLSVNSTDRSQIRLKASLMKAKKLAPSLS